MSVIIIETLSTKISNKSKNATSSVLARAFSLAFAIVRFVCFTIFPQIYTDKLKFIGHCENGHRVVREDVMDVKAYKRWEQWKQATAVELNITVNNCAWVTDRIDLCIDIFRLHYNPKTNKYDQWICFITLNNLIHTQEYHVSDHWCLKWICAQTVTRPIPFAFIFTLVELYFKYQFRNFKIQ